MTSNAVVERIKTALKNPKLIPYLMGVGLCLFVIHSPAQPGITYDPETDTYSGIFLPHIGLAIIIACSFGILARGKIDWGPKWAWIPLAIIVASMAARLIISQDMKTMTALMFGLTLFAVYLSCRKMGEDVFKPITVLVIVQAISMVVIGIMNGERTGGLISYPSPNYDIATGVLIFGAALSIGKSQWVVVTIAMVGLVFSAGLEMAAGVVVIALVVLIRRDFGIRILVPVMIAIVLIVVVLVSGHFGGIYKTAIARVTDGMEVDNKLYPHNVTYDVEGEEIVITYDYSWEEKLDTIITMRYSMWKRAVQQLKPLGHGYEVVKYNFTTVHNVILIIVDQLGVAAAVAWLYMIIIGLVKTGWRYAFVAVLALSLFDHYIWTQMAFWVPALVGVSTASVRRDDRIFVNKKNN